MNLRATKNLVKKLQKKYNKEDIVVIKRVNEALVVTEGNMKNIKGEYKVNVICQMLFPCQIFDP
jgi:accessory colonization factor AcfC